MPRTPYSLGPSPGPCTLSQFRFQHPQEPYPCPHVSQNATRNHDLHSLPYLVHPVANQEPPPRYRLHKLLKAQAASLALVSHAFSDGITRTFYRGCKRLIWLSAQRKFPTAPSSLMWPHFYTATQTHGLLVHEAILFRWTPALLYRV